MRITLGLALFTACAPKSTPSGTSEPTHDITLLHLADTHAQLETHYELLPGAQPELQLMGGFARLKTLIERERARAKGAVFVADGGDTFQGSGPAAWTEGEVVLAPFNALGIDVCVPGNWEVVYGPTRFRDLMSRVTCTPLAYNFHDTHSGERLFAPSKTLERAGARVTFVGITDPTTSERQPPAQVAGLDTTRMQGLRELVKELRARERPALVVAVTHTGLTVSRQLAREIPELDVILSGHTHERTPRTIQEGNTLIVEPGSLGSFLGRLHLQVRGGRVVAHDFALLPVRAADVPEDPAVKELVDRSLAPHRARAREVLAHTETMIARYDMLETTTDDVITDALRAATGADIGLSNGFRFAPPIPPGPITEGDLWNMLPMDARVKTGWVTGAELRSYLERELELVFSKDAWKLSGGWGPRASGMKLTFEAHARPGQRVRAIEVGGEPLRDDARYTIAGCEREGEPADMVCRLKGVRDAAVQKLGIHDVVRRYLREQRVLRPTREGRSVATDLPSSVFSQDAVLRGGRVAR